MTRQYPIIIEVDNKRALAAYTRGLEHLDAAWPRLMEVSQAEDARHAEQMAAIDAAQKKAYEEQKQAYERAIGEYLEQQVHYIKWENTPAYRRGACPPKPCRPFPPMPPWPSISKRPSSVALRELGRSGLVSKRNMAAAANGPFNMSEQDANAMIRWESGEIVEQMLAQAGVRP